VTRYAVPHSPRGSFSARYAGPHSLHRRSLPPPPPPPSTPLTRRPPPPPPFLSPQTCGHVETADSAGWVRAHGALPASFGPSGSIDFRALLHAVAPERYTVSAVGTNERRVKSDMRKLVWSMGVTKVLSRAVSTLMQLAYVARGRYHRQHFPMSVLKLPSLAGGMGGLDSTKCLDVSVDELGIAAITARTHERIAEYPHTWPVTGLEHHALKNHTPQAPLP
jgi:hypothetical protein